MRLPPRCARVFPFADALQGGIPRDFGGSTMAQGRTLRLNLQEYRADPTERVWELPAWGHPAAMMVMPLFLNIESRFTPIGTAFAVGRGLGLVMSALHNIVLALAEDPRFDRARSQGSLPAAATLERAGLSVLHQVPNDAGGLTLNFLPLSSIEGAPPTDIVIGSARMP